MYNFWRFFPDCAVVFCAPTKPLVQQQVCVCVCVIGCVLCDEV